MVEPPSDGTVAMDRERTAVRRAFTSPAPGGEYIYATANRREGLGQFDAPHREVAERLVRAILDDEHSALAAIRCGHANDVIVVARSPGLRAR